MKRALGILIVALVAVSLAGCATWFGGGSSGGGKTYKIGVLLPISGKFALYGNSTLQGVQCAAGVTPPCSSPMKLNLIVKDSGDTSQSAAQAVKELEKEDVLAIIGPLVSSTVEGATKKAEELKVPLISLSQKEDAEDIGDFIFKHSLTPKDQVDTLVDYGVGKKGIKNYGILYPTGNYGSYFARAFRAAVEAAGGRVVFEKRYSYQDLGATAKAKESGGITSVDSATNPETNAVPEKRFVVPSNVQALFIPDSYKAVKYVVAAVREDSNLAPGMLFMGVNRWNNPGLVSGDTSSLEGSVFVDGFFKNSSDSMTKNFVQSFMNAYGIEPTILEAQAFDATRLVMTGIKNGGTSRAKLRASISNIRNMQGASGNISIDNKGDSHRKLFILTVKNGSIAELSSSRGEISINTTTLPYSKVSKANSSEKYDGAKSKESLSVRTDREKYEAPETDTPEF